MIYGKGDVRCGGVCCGQGRSGDGSLVVPLVEICIVTGDLVSKGTKM